MNKNYQTPIMEIIEFDNNVETQGASTTIDYPWQKDENGNLFG